MRLYSRVGEVRELDEQLDVWEHDLKKYTTTQMAPIGWRMKIIHIYTSSTLTTPSWARGKKL
jgi:hypothetical protein